MRPLATLLLLALAARPAPAACSADFDADGVVDVYDLLIVLTCGTPPCEGDVNGDGVVDGEDLALLLFHWGPCEQDQAVGSTSAELAVENVTDPTTAAQGLREYEVLVQMADPEEVVISVFDATITCACPDGFADDPTANALPLDEVFWELLELTFDTFVTIGPRFGDDNASAVDPSFQFGFDALSGGWYQASPGFTQGRAGDYPGNCVLLATFTTAVNTSIDGALTVAFKDAAGDPFFGAAQFALGAGAGDVDGDGTVGIADFLAVLGSWGPCPGPTEPCAADLDGSGDVGIEDFLIVLGRWG